MFNDNKVVIDVYLFTFKAAMENNKNVEKKFFNYLNDELKSIFFRG